jgi:hypothetical protein
MLALTVGTVVPHLTVPEGTNRKEDSTMVESSSARAFAEAHGDSSAQVKTVLEKLVTAYESADDGSHAQVRDLVAKAKSGVRSSEVVKLLSGTAAILFFDYNKQNREWQPASTLEYAQDIADGDWEFHNQGIGFLESGDLGDGQHRLAGIAYSGQTVELPVVFGMKPQAIIAIDIGRRRQASDFLGIGNQVDDPKRKQAMVRSAFSTMRRVAANEEDARPWVLRPGNRDMVKAIQKHDHLLGEAIGIGDESVRGRSKPTFKAHEAAAFAFVLLLKGWPKARIIADLDTFQTGEDREGGNSPLFIASDQLQKDAAKRESSSLVARFSAAIKAFVLHEQGIKNVRVSDIRNAMKAKTQVDAGFPGGQVHQLSA